MNKKYPTTICAVLCCAGLLAITNRCLASAYGVDVAANDISFQIAIRKLVEKDLNSIEFSSAVETEFRTARFSEALGSVTADSAPSEIRPLFNALSMKSFYSLLLVDALALEKLAMLLKAKKDLRPTEAKAVFGALLGARAFERAKLFQNAVNPTAAETLPKTIDLLDAGSARTLWLIDQSNRVIERKLVPEFRGAQLIVVASTQCQFSVRAMTAIAADTALSAAVPTSTLWIVPPERSLPFTALQRWNQSHDLLQFALVNKKDEWPFIDSWDTPEFHFLKDGKVVDRLTGWPRDGSNEQKLLSKLRELNLPAPKQ